MAGSADWVLAGPAQVREIPVGYFFINTPAMGDLDGDGQLEFVVTANGADLSYFMTAGSGIVTVVRSDGTLMPGWPVITDEEIALLPPTPATVSDLDGDGRDEVIFGHGHTLYVFKGDGQLLWKQPVEGFFRKKPEAADLNSDGVMEIINGADQFLGQAQVHIWYADGQPYPGSPLVLQEYFVSSPSVHYEGHYPVIAVGAGNGYTEAAGAIYLFNCVRGDLQLRWRHEIGQHPISKPVFADVDLDGQAELIGGTYTPSVYAVRITDGTFLPGWPQRVYGSVFTPPAVYQAQGRTIVLTLDLAGILHAWDDQGHRLWMTVNDPNAIDQITLADFIGDEEPEIILGVNGGVKAFDLQGNELGRWELGNYWVTGTLIASHQQPGTSRLVLGGVDNFTEEAKLFILQP